MSTQAQSEERSWDVHGPKAGSGKEEGGASEREATEAGQVLEARCWSDGLPLWDLSSDCLIDPSS